jgi:hypothetical protein
MNFQDAAIAVLREENRALHWTVIQDLALKRGYLDPFTQPDIRRGVISALATAATAGLVIKEGRGVYRLARAGSP